jgi:hypothetical protein
VCIAAAFLLVYVEADEELKGGLLEIGAGLASGATVVIVGNVTQLVSDFPPSSSTTTSTGSTLPAQPSLGSSRTKRVQMPSTGMNNTILIGSTSTQRQVP